jgi:hypothetical protein
MKKENNFWLLSFFVFVAAITRVLPHPDNVTAIGAMALFGGTYFNNRKTALLMPLVAMFFSDMLLEVLFRLGVGNTPGIHNTLPFVYLAFFVAAAIGFWVKKNITFARVFGGGVLASLVFFIITNFAVWLSGFYGFTLEGLITCYVAAIPFYRNTFIGDMVFITLLFGSFEYLKQTAPQVAFVKVK